MICMVLPYIASWVLFLNFQNLLKVTPAKCAQPPACSMRDAEKRPPLGGSPPPPPLLEDGATQIAQLGDRLLDVGQRRVRGLLARRGGGLLGVPAAGLVETGQEGTEQKSEDKQVKARSRAGPKKGAGGGLLGVPAAGLQGGRGRGGARRRR